MSDQTNAAKRVKWRRMPTDWQTVGKEEAGFCPNENKLQKIITSQISDKNCLTASFKVMKNYIPNILM